MRLLTLFTLLFASTATADIVEPREGWAIHGSPKSYADMVDAVKEAAKTNGLGVVTQAGPTGAAKARGITIPGNRVIGLFNNDFAVRVLALSTAAMIEAPIRMYVTENEDGTSTLAYKMPSHVFSPYLDEGGPELSAISVDLDAIFADVAADALQ